MIIYVITNKINGKQYVGQTVQRLENRWKFHLSKASRCLALRAAIEKYGKENFIIECMDFANSLEELNKKEIEWIDRLDSLAPSGYNLKTGGNAPTYSEESRKKMSESRKKYKQSDESIKKGALSRTGPGNPNFGKKFSDEHRKKLSDAHRGNTSALGHKKTEEAKRKISEGHKGLTPWNKGLTIEDPRVFAYSNSHKLVK